MRVACDWAGVGEGVAGGAWRASWGWSARGVELPPAMGDLTDTTEIQTQLDC